MHRDCGDTARKTKFLKLRGRWASLNSGYPPRVSFHPKLCGCDFPRCSKRFMRGPSTAWEALNYLGFAILCRVRFWKEDRKRSYKSLILRLNSFSNLLNMEPRRCSDSSQPLISFPPPILWATRQWIKHRRANLLVHVQAITVLLFSPRCNTNSGDFIRLGQVESLIGQFLDRWKNKLKFNWVSLWTVVSQCAQTGTTQQLVHSNGMQS